MLRRPHNWLSVSIFICLIILWVCSTPILYSIAFLPSHRSGNANCAILVDDSSDVIRSAILFASANRLGVKTYLTSLSPDPITTSQLDDFFMMSHGIEFVSFEEARTGRLSKCTFVYSPHLYCSLHGLENKYTLLPNVKFNLLPEAEYMAINFKTIKNCIEIYLH